MPLVCRLESPKCNYHLGLGKLWPNGLFGQQRLYQTKPSGLTRTVFVSVDDAGGVNRSYGDQASVDFAAIEDELYVIDCAQEASA